MRRNRNNRRNNVKKERIIMIASSAFVMAALTMTGIYMKDNSVKNKDSGYTIDFTALENNVEEKVTQIAKNSTGFTQNELGGLYYSDANEDQVASILDDDLDYMPMGELSVDVNSGNIEIPGLTDGTELAEEEKQEEQSQDNAATAAESVQTLNFTEDQGIIMPVSGDVLMPFTAESTIYFATLDQYKANPALVISASEGSNIVACADAQVVSIYNDVQIGQAVTLDLGNGYFATYGQLENIQLSEGQFINQGDLIGTIATPTIYYSVEGSNLYFAVNKDGSPINPESLVK